MSIVESFHHQLLPKTMKNGRLPGNQKTSRSHWKKHIIFQSNFSQLFPLTHTHEKMLNSALFFLYPHSTQITFNEILSCVNMSVKITNVWLRRQEKKNFDKWRAIAPATCLFLLVLLQKLSFPFVLANCKAFILTFSFSIFFVGWSQEW